jgi:hypothetical protein
MTEHRKILAFAKHAGLDGLYKNEDTIRVIKYDVQIRGMSRDVMIEATHMR